MLVDTGKLYQAALATYGNSCLQVTNNNVLDLSLACMVAQRSQMDPKEYLPQVGYLRFRLYTIQTLVKRA